MRALLVRANRLQPLLTRTADGVPIRRFLRFAAADLIPRLTVNGSIYALHEFTTYRHPSQSSTVIVSLSSSSTKALVNSTRPPTRRTSFLPDNAFSIMKFAGMFDPRELELIEKVRARSDGLSSPALQPPELRDCGSPARRLLQTWRRAEELY